MSPQKILMCAPEYYGVEYVINPWMVGQIGHSDDHLARQQWAALSALLGAEVELAFIPPQPKLPDLVFTANAGMVIGRTAIVSRFRTTERQGEERFNQAWFEENGFAIADWPQDIAFEGAGDALLDRGQEIIWSGYGFRSDRKATDVIQEIFNRKTVPLRLADPRFYHLDTCLCPLTGGYLMYFPAAFDAESRIMLERLVAQDKRIMVQEEDALHFACNAVDVNGKIFMNFASQKLTAQLNAAGFQVVTTPLTEFLKAGGAAKCLTLKLHEE